MYFDLGKYQKTYPSAYAKFREYIVYRMGDKSMKLMEELNVQIDLGMKNTHIPAFEGYLMNFFNKYDIKISIHVTRKGRYAPQVFRYKAGSYSNQLTQLFDTRYDAVLKAIDYSFAKLNVELLVNAVKIKPADDV